jgi:hypothetical protein
MMQDGTVAALDYIEQPQITQLEPGTPPLALFVASGYTHRCFTWAQRFFNQALMGGLGPADPAAPAVPPSRVLDMGASSSSLRGALGDALFPPTTHPGLL